MKKITKYITENIRPPLLALLVSCIAGSVAAQNDDARLSEKFKNLARPGSTKEWISFRDSTKINPRTIFIEFKEGFDLSSNDELVIKKVKKDDMGFNHFRYQQYYKKIPVLYAEYIVHQQPEGFVKSANGRLVTKLNLNATASVTEKQALESALRFMNAGKYLWQNPEMEKELKRQQNNPQATYFPKGALVYAPDKYDGHFNAADYKLTWSFRIYTDNSDVKAKDVYVDANTGKVIHSMDISMTCSGGSGTSAYNGSVSINTEFSGGVYRSHNDCQSTDIYVYNCNGGNASNTFYTDVDNSWAQQSAVQAQWGAMMTYNYYYGQHSRQSWDGAAGDMIAYNNSNASGLGPNNACWGCTGNNTIYGQGSTSAANDDWNTNDIMGHEFTHGVTQSEAGLVYSNESGALNESFSDIFGEMVESWSEGICDYFVGADRGAIRSFISPNDYNDPDTYLGTNWYMGSADNGGVHTNSGVQNHWFYLLSEGGSGVNDLGKSYSVAAITRFKARLIAYRALTEYLTSGSQYIDARKATLEAAYDLYGQCSPEIIAVGDAWHAVGVESQSPAFAINACGNYPAGGTFIQALSTLYGGNGCTTTITASATTVYFTGRDAVVLLPGFTAVNGSNFVAYLEPCSSTRWRPAAPIESDAEKNAENGIVAKAKPSQEAALAVDKSKSIVTVAPNPFTKSFTITVNAPAEAKGQIAVYNSFGVRVKQQTGVNLVKGTNTLSFDLSNFAAGVYTLEVSFGNSKEVKKIVKSN